MNSRDITLWIDERWYDALTKHLKGKTLEEHLENVIEEMCNNLPRQEYESIRAEIWQEQQDERKAREAARRFAVFHVTEGGSSTYFLAEENLEFLQIARRIRSYIRKSGKETPAQFTGMFPHGGKVSREQFDEYVSERLDNTGRVVGAFDIDLDNGYLDALNMEEVPHPGCQQRCLLCPEEKLYFIGRTAAHLSGSSARKRGYIRTRGSVSNWQSDAPRRRYLLCRRHYSERQPTGVLHGSIVQCGSSVWNQCLHHRE